MLAARRPGGTLALGLALLLVNAAGVAAGADAVPDGDPRLFVPRGRQLRAEEGGVMAAISFEHVTKRFDDTTAVDDLSLEVADHEFLVLVGPSGCGKTTALRLLAGLEEATAGRISIGAEVVNHVAPGARDVAMVFQSYALYPHMTVFDNLAFSLRNRGVARGGGRASRAGDGGVARARAALRASRSSSRAASANGSRSDARSSASPRRSCSTSRSRTSTLRSASRRVRRS